MHDLPMSIRAIVDSANVTPITAGMSADEVYRIDADETYYLKIGNSLKAESERLQWLEGKLPTPRMIHFEVNRGNHYLLTSAIKGKMMYEADLPIDRRLELMAEGAQMWHSLPIEDCPFDFTIHAQIDAARHELDNGRVHAHHFDSIYFGKSPHELFSDLLNAMPDGEEDLVVTHGDYCLPNILVDVERDCISGFVDVGDMGISDRHLDLVLGSRSIQFNLGGKYINRFYQLYDIKRDHAKYHFYSILNEFV